MSNHLVVASHGSQARRLVLVFVLTVTAFVLGIDFLVVQLFGLPFASERNAWFLCSFLMFLGACGLFQLLRLTGDGNKVARLLGGGPVPLEPRDAALRRFRTVATETAVAAALPIPALFVIEHESAINALAAGTPAKGQAVCVSRGALQKLTRDELQGVVAHEMAHLRHGDVGLSRLLASGLFALLCFTLVGKLLLSIAATGRSDLSKDGAFAVVAAVCLGLAVLVLGALGWLAASILDAAVSRQMEFRADADAVRMLSDSSGLVGALVKLGEESGALPAGTQGVLQGANPMFFNAAAKRYWFDTHPPLLARIRALDPERAEELEARLRQQ